MLCCDSLFQGEFDLAGDVIIMLDELCVSENGMRLVPELYLVAESNVIAFLRSKSSP